MLASRGLDEEVPGVRRRLHEIAERHLRKSSGDRDGRERDRDQSSAHLQAPLVAIG